MEENKNIYRALIGLLLRSDAVMGFFGSHQLLSRVVRPQPRTA